MSRSRTAVLAAALIVSLAGCAQNSGPAPSPPAPVHLAPRPSSSATRATGSAAPVPGPTGGVSPMPTVEGCETAKLTGTLGPGQGGAAGHVGVTLVLTNTGMHACALQGWPGVSFVGNGNGTRLGAAAVFIRNAPPPAVELRPGGTAHALLVVGNAANYPTDACKPQPADGFRVYPPGSRTSLFIEDHSFTTCTEASAPLLQVGPLTAG